LPRLIGSDFIIGLAKISPGSANSNISSGPFAGGLFIARMNAGVRISKTSVYMLEITRLCSPQTCRINF
jgi:hypothetical protein